MLRMKNIALHGAYHGDNFGDSLFVILFVDWLKELNGNYNKNIYLPFAGDRIRKLVNVSDKRGLKCLFLADLFVFVGGGYLGEPTGNIKMWSCRLIIKHLSIAFVAYILKKPYIFIGVGAGPLSYKLARRLTVFICNKSKKVIIRDKESYDYLIEYGVFSNKLIITADSILSFSKKNVKPTYVNIIKQIIKKQNNGKYIGVHLPSINEKYMDKLLLLIQDLEIFCKILPGCKIIVFNDHFKKKYDYRDHQVFLLLKQIFIENIMYFDYENPDMLIALISELDIVITSKLHCGIVANCFNKYTVSIAVHEKTKRLYNQLGIESRHTSISSYKKGDLHILLEEYNSDENSYFSVSQRIREKAMENKEELFCFIKANSN